MVILAYVFSGVEEQEQTFELDVQCFAWSCCYRVGKSTKRLQLENR